MQRLGDRMTIKKTMYAPNTAGSGGGDRWYAELRKDGCLMRDGYFDTEGQAQSWLKKQKSATMSKSVACQYIKMVKRWKNK